SRRPIDPNPLDAAGEPPRRLTTPATLPPLRRLRGSILKADQGFLGAGDLFVDFLERGPCGLELTQPVDRMHAAPHAESGQIPVEPPIGPPLGVLHEPFEHGDPPLTDHFLDLQLVEDRPEFLRLLGFAREPLPAGIDGRVPLVIVINIISINLPLIPVRTGPVESEELSVYSVGLVLIVLDEVPGVVTYIDLRDVDGDGPDPGRERVVHQSHRITATPLRHDVPTRRFP